MSLLGHSRAWLPREESRSFRPAMQGFSGFLTRARHARGNDKERTCYIEVASLYCAKFYSTTGLQNPTGLQTVIHKGTIFKALSICTAGIAVA